MTLRRFLLPLYLHKMCWLFCGIHLLLVYNLVKVELSYLLAVFFRNSQGWLKIGYHKQTQSKDEEELDE